MKVGMTHARRKLEQEWRRLQSAARPSLKQLLMSEKARTHMAIAPRGKAKRRPVEPML